MNTQAYSSPYIDDVTDVQSLLEAIRAILQYWLDCHTQAEAWAEMYAQGWELRYWFKETPILENDYFSFDWRKACIRVWARENVSNLYRCSECRCLYDVGYDCPDCENAEMESLTMNELVEWLDDVGTEWLEFRDDQIYDALVIDGFRAYREALEPITRGIEKEIKDALKMIEDAEENGDRAEVMAAVLWASHVQHVSGNVLNDWGEQLGLTLDVDALQNDGLMALFDEDEIEEYFQGGNNECLYGRQ